VFVAAALAPTSASGRLVRRFLEHHDFEAVASEAILVEIEAALNAPMVGRSLQADAGAIHRWVGSYGLLATVVEMPLADGIEVLQSLGGGVLVTLDRDLLEGPAPPAVEVVGPEVLLAVLTART
jgi:predicted nucleic acid-binding protein